MSGIGIGTGPAFHRGGGEPPSNAAPIISSVTISGTPSVGEILSASIAWTQAPWPPGTPSYQWERDGAAILGATSSTYTLTGDDVGTSITLEFSITNSEGSDGPVTSNAITGITATPTAPSIDGVPAISGTEAVGSTLTVTPAAATGVPDPTITLQWQSAPSLAGPWSDIAGATSSTYVLASGDEGDYVRVVQTETNSEGVATATSAATGQIAAAPAFTQYAANSFEPDYVADFSAASADYFRVAGSDSDFATAFTSDSEGGGLATQVDSSGNLVWRAHNLYDDSENFAGWAAVGFTITSNTATSPDGTNSADTITATSTAGSLQKALTVLATSYTLVFFAKYIDNPWIRISQKSSSDNAAWFNIQTGTAGVVVGAGNTSSISDVGNGWYRCQLNIAAADPSSTTTFISLNDADGGTAMTVGREAYVWGAHLYRSDLGGMADNPDPVATGLEKYVPTTTAARYLARRRHHRWNGSAWVPTCLHEPVGATNLVAKSRDFNSTDYPNTVGSVGRTQNQTGIDGQSNTAWTLEDDSAGSLEAMRANATVPDDNNPVLVSYFFKKTTSAASFPGLQVLLAGGTTVVGAATLNTDDGTVTNRSGEAPTDAFAVDEGDWWRFCVVVTNNGTGNTAVQGRLFPAVNTDGSATWSVATTGTCVADQCDIIANATLPSSPIPTNGSTVTRTADTLKGKAASLPWDITGVSLAMSGRASYADTDSNPEFRFYRWTDVGGADFIIVNLDTAGANTGQVDALQRKNTGTVIASSTAADALSPGVGVAYSVASRHTPTAIQVALAGAAAAAGSGSDTLDDLSGEDLLIGESSIGTVDTIRLWSDDIAEAGLEESTA